MATHDERVMDLIAEQAAAWYVEHRADELSPQQKQEFMRWLSASPLHVAEYLSLTGLAPDVGRTARGSDIPLARLVEQVTAESSLVSWSPLASANSGNPTISRFGSWLSGAALVPRPAVPWVLPMLVCLISAVWWYSTYRDHSYVTGRGEERTWTLPDHTVVHLNSDSSVAVRFSALERRVEIERGQALFEVAKDGKRPFRVRAGDSLIEDVGTVFDVFRQDNQTTRVTVVQGQVLVFRSPAAGSDSASRAPLQRIADLHAGEQVTVAIATPIEPAHAVNVQKATAWEKQEIVFERDSIASVAAEFNRYNELQIHVDDPQVAAQPISGVFHTHDVDSFQQFLNTLPGVHATMMDQRMMVTALPAGSTGSH